jgi:hypothetical protein
MSVNFELVTLSVRRISCHISSHLELGFVFWQADSSTMADGAEDVQPLVLDNGSGMVKVQ